MKTILTICLFFYAMSSIAQAAPGTSSGPIKLTAAQMDTVTAGFVGVSVHANALALGRHTATDTDTDTKVRSFRKQGWKVELGFGSGQAVAGGSRNTRANVSANAFGDGEIVFVGRTSVNLSSRQFSAARKRIFVLSLTPPPGWDGSNLKGSNRLFSRIVNSTGLFGRNRQNILANYNVDTHITGHSATADATADAVGRDTDTDTYTNAHTSPAASVSTSRSLAIAR